MIEWHEGGAHVVWSDATSGGLGHVPPRGPHNDYCCGAGQQAQRDALAPGPWLALTQTHGSQVVLATSMAERDRYTGAEADAAVTTVGGVTLAIATADCASIGLIGDNGVIGAVHGGWKGLADGVVDAAVQVMRANGAQSIQAGLGPCIHSECYEFGAAELTGLVNRWGEGVRGTSSSGQPAFDLPAAVSVVCAQSDVELVYVSADCTACSGSYYSYRARQDDLRQVMAVWRD